jgi:hypothetical protein
VAEIPKSEYILKRIVFKAFGDCRFKLGNVKILVVTQKQVSLVYVTEAADQHRSLTSVIFDARLRKRI